MNVKSVVKPSVVPVLFENTRELILERNLMIVLNVVKPSARLPALSNIRESTQERNPMNVLSAGRLLVTAHPVLSI